jgi:hypothetical protein
VSDDTTPFTLIQRPLERQLRALNVALRGAAADRAFHHAAYAVALMNEATDLSLTAEDLLQALLDGAERQSTGQGVIDALLELGVRRRLVDRGWLVIEDGVRRFTRDETSLRVEVRTLLGTRADSEVDRDPRWRALLDD